MFEIYKPKQGRGSEGKEKTPFVSLSKNSIVLNKQAREKIQNATRIEVAYDSETNILRIKPDENGLILKKTKIFSRGIFTHFGIDKKGRFPVTFNEEHNALYLNLNEKPAM